MATNLSNQIKKCGQAPPTPIWQKGYLTMKKEFRYAVDWENENIEISKAFATAAQKAKTTAHKQLMEIRKAYPGFRVIIRKTEIKESKQTLISSSILI